MALLAICVPIWNSIREVDQTIKALSDPNWGRFADIELLLSDNFSDDGTWERLQASAQNLDPRVRLLRQGSNLGFRGNLRALTESSSSRYLWFLGAGETINMFQLNGLLEMLEAEEPACVILSGVVGEPRVSATPILLDQIHRGYPFSETISLNIFRRDAILDFFSVGQNPLVSADSWPHLEIALLGMERGKVFKQTGSPLVYISANPHGWWFHGEKAFDIYSDKLFLGSRAVGVRGSSEFRRYRGIGAILHIVEVRLHGTAQSRESFLRLVNLLSPVWRPVSLFLYLMPRQVLLGLARLKRLIFGVN